VEILYNEYDFAGAFAVASLLTLLALVTLVAKKAVERLTRPALVAAEAPQPAGEIAAGQAGR
jgi:ABC-type sulfate transport system permease subunit